jgi:ribosomal protein L13
MTPDRSSRHSTAREHAARRASATGGSAGALVAEVAQLVRERDEFARQVAILDAKLIELTDRMLEGEAVRAAYRRGYYAGRASQRRGAPAVPDPERHARGWIREVLAT